MNSLFSRAVVMACLLTASAHADIIRVNYDLDNSRFEIRGTPFGLGDGSFDVGPGNLVIDYEVTGNDIADGAVQMRSYALLLQFTSGTTGLQITTDLTTQANFSGSQQSAGGTLTNGVLTWTQTFPYRAQGSNTCNGGFCGFAGFQDGVPQVIDGEDPFLLAPFRFGAGGPQAGAGFVADEVEVPGNEVANTFLILSGTEISRVRIDTTPPVVTLVGDASISVDCGGDFADPGVSASDNYSISAGVTVGGQTVDTSTPGVYVITYDVNDDQGNAAVQVTRTVTVLDNCPVEEGAVEAAIEGEGSVDGDGATDGEGSVDGDGAVDGEGIIEGAPDGAPDGEGIADGAIEGEGTADGEGSPEGIQEGDGAVDGEGTPEGEGALDGEGADLEGEGIIDGEGGLEGEGVVEGEGEGTLEGEGQPEAEGSLEGIHSADTDADSILSLSEVLRVIQFYNASSFGCESGSEDGFGLSTNRTCQPHDADYISQDWIIELSELLRIIQLYNFREYSACEESLDGFCAG